MDSKILIIGGVGIGALLLYLLSRKASAGQPRTLVRYATPPGAQAGSGPLMQKYGAVTKPEYDEIMQLVSSGMSKADATDYVVSKRGQ